MLDVMVSGFQNSNADLAFGFYGGVCVRVRQLHGDGPLTSINNRSKKGGRSFTSYKS